MNSLALKYEAMLRQNFRDIEAALASLDALRSRLPVAARTVRFQAGGCWEDAVLPESSSASSAASPRRVSLPRGASYYGDDEDRKFAPNKCDDFLTDAAPLGRGVVDAALFACFDGETPFFTSDSRIAEMCAHATPNTPKPPPDGDNATPGDDGDAAGDRGGIRARTILYQKLDDAQQIAIDQDDEIWAADIDGRPYYYCVMEDGSDRGLRHLLNVGGVDDDALLAFKIAFTKVE